MDFDKNEHLKRQAMDFRYLKRNSTFLVSVSVFSLALAFSFSVFSVFPHAFSVYYSTFFSLFTRTIARKYMFLVCNGILFFLARCSFDFGSASSHSEFNHLVEKDSDSDLSSVNAMDVPEEEEQKQETTAEAEQETATEVAENGSVRALDDQLETGNSIGKEDQEYKVGLTDEAEEEEEEEAAAVSTAGSEEVITSTEELNRKIEEFIRKVKEEMKIEAQTQLIAV